MNQKQTFVKHNICIKYKQIIFYMYKHILFDMYENVLHTKRYTL